MSNLIESYLKLSPVIPVIVIREIQQAIPLANALLAGGIKIIEITLRSEAALPAIQQIRENVPTMVVGAGTITNPSLVQQAVAAGSQFLVSPGVTQQLLDEVQKHNCPLLPGAASPTEAMRLQQAGFKYLKFFPAEAAGGTGMLKSLHGPFPDLKFCPTGGIDQTNIKEYLITKNVICAGSSWVAAADLIENNNWSEITRRAREILSIGRNNEC